MHIIKHKEKSLLPFDKEPKSKKWVRLKNHVKKKLKLHGVRSFMTMSSFDFFLSAMRMSDYHNPLN